MTRRRRFLVALAAIAVIAAGTTVAVVLSGGGGGAPSQLVSPDAFARVVTEPGVVTIDVLGPGAPSIEGTDLMIPADLLTARRGELPQTSTRLAVYCWSGHTSARAVRILHGLGYRRIVELRGGMLAWQASGLPLT